MKQESEPVPDIDVEKFKLWVDHVRPQASTPVEITMARVVPVLCQALEKHRDALMLGPAWLGMRVSARIAGKKETVQGKIVRLSSRTRLGLPRFRVRSTRGDFWCEGIPTPVEERCEAGVHPKGATVEVLLEQDK
jgi:hypothetical protein